MQLTNEQIQYLFQFTEKKFVRWYDLQIELVDHLASRIEEMMDADASLSFESALEKVYKGFGIFGFAKVVQEKELQVQRTARNIWWNEIRQFFTWPKIVLLVFIMSVLWQLTLFFDVNILMVAFASLYVLSSVIVTVYLIRSYKVGRKLLLLQFGRFHYSSIVFIYEFFILFGFYNVNAFWFCIFATTGILIKFASFQLFYKVKQKAVQIYPEAFA